MPSERTQDCSWFEERIDSYLDGTLSEDERERANAHAASCEACEGELKFARTLLDGLHALPEHRCPDDVVDRARAAAGVDRPTLRERVMGWLEPRVTVLMRPAMATMILIVAAVGVFVLTQRNTMNEADRLAAEEASREVLVAFAYVGKYTTLGTEVFRDEVMADRVIPTVARAVRDSRNEAIARAFLPIFETPEKKDVTAEEPERSPR